MATGNTLNKEDTSKDINPADFELDNLRKCFAECLQEDGTLLVDKYILGYEEIYRFLCLLGTVFGWVASDVAHKTDVLREHFFGKEADSYKTVQSMVQHEIDTGLVRVNAKHKDCKSGARNLLRLHRALAYINGFLECLPAMAEDDSCCPHSQNAYKKTLSKHHPWVVQKAALLAMNMLPTKQGLIQKICGDSQEAYEEATRVLPLAIKAMQAVYDKTQEIYEKHNLLDIP